MMIVDHVMLNCLFRWYITNGNLFTFYNIRLEEDFIVLKNENVLGITKEYKSYLKICSFILLRVRAYTILSTASINPKVFAR